MTQNNRSRNSNRHQTEPQRRNRSREFESAAKKVRFDERKYGGESSSNRIRKQEEAKKVN